MSQSKPESETNDITLLLDRWSHGDAAAFDLATEVVYPELHRIAAAYLQRERSDHTLQPTALIHEAFLKLSESANLRFESRGHFYALAAHLMRRILVDHARAVKAAKRGGDAVKISLDRAPEVGVAAADTFLRVHEALNELTALSARKAQIVELRYFGGMTLDEVAQTLNISIATAHREQRLAEAWLTQHLAG